TSERAFEMIPPSIFQKPRVPLIDGRGVIWQPYSTRVEELYSYTLGHQVVAPYDFTRAVTVGLKEFAPDVVILLGPGSSLGGSIGQIMVEINWRGVDGKQSFTELQATNPVLLAMGRADQRNLVI